jgi:hypothetical protein
MSKIKAKHIDYDLGTLSLTDDGKLKASLLDDSIGVVTISSDVSMATDPHEIPRVLTNHGNMSDYIQTISTYGFEVLKTGWYLFSGIVRIATDSTYDYALAYIEIDGSRDASFDLEESDSISARYFSLGGQPVYLEAGQVFNISIDTQTNGGFTARSQYTKWFIIPFKCEEAA